MNSDGIKNMQFYLIFIFTCVIKNAAVDTFSNSVQEKRDEVQSPLLARHPRDVNRRVRKKSAAESFGTAVYFNGAEQHLKLRSVTKEGRIELPRRELTVQLWVKPEGGQGSYTPIVAIEDECSPSRVSGRWSVGISQHNHRREGARFVFSLQTDGASETSHLFAHRKYDANVWTNVASTYDGTQMNMYINGAKISLSNEQKGPIYGETSAKCKQLFLGGSETERQYFRGELDELRIWDRALGHQEIVENMQRTSRDLADDVTRVLMEPFATLTQWRVRPSLEPEIIKSDVPLPDHHLRFEAPPCGKTVCDDPSAVLSYADNSQLRNEKVVKYRVINFVDDDGTNPMLTDKNVFEQNKLLNKAFAPYNITFILEQLNIKNTSLRRKSVLIRCFPRMIGNGNCDEDCAHSSLGNDGGDCDDIMTECDDGLLGNGRCDTVCNKGYHGYDGGDCCMPGEDVHKTCIDPSSPFRGYINIEDLKLDLQLEGLGQVNVFLLTAPWYRQQFRGLATYPWEKNVYTTMGGTVMHVDAFGHANKLKNLVHEFGHTFGLWHVHHGVSEVKCDSECRETHPSMILGDLCSDTNPTPRNRKCHDPFIDPYNTDEETCGQYNFQNTPYNNYMSYADDSCIDHFTPQQVARMHCYLDLVYQPMREMKAPAPVPLAPKVVEATDGWVRIVWLEPLGTDSTCDSNNRLYQFADVATSSHSDVRWSPQEATGFPDAGGHCFPSYKAWMPHFYDGPAYCEPKECWLELGFKSPVIPSRLTVWVADLLSETELSIELVGADGYTVHVGTLPAYCDMEASLVVKTKKRIDKVRIYTSHKHVAIDAVQIVSVEDFPKCVRKRPPKYRLIRDPPFSGGYMLLGEPEFTDSDVKRDVGYRYSVQTVAESRTSVMSPSLTYQHGQPFCGDGHVTESEECDDRNSFDGDGCNIACRLEEGFKCKGSPSLCYIYRGDGLCEPFEEGDNIKDCGLYTPDGFFDHWAFSATANPKYQKPECPPSAVTGVPDRQLKCSAQPTGSSFWRPCREYGDVSGSFWIQATLYRPVVAVSVLIFLASDGVTEYNQEQKYIHVALVTEQDDLVDLQPTAIPVRCRDNPVQVNVIQDISLPFFLTKGVRISFTYSSISIASVGVRSSNFINPPVIRSCQKSELYNPRSGTCVDQACNTRTCGPFPVKYGDAICSGEGEGDTCHVQCNTGYFVDGHPNKAVCADGQWMTSSPIVCSPVDCGRLKVEHATTHCKDGTFFPQQCQFKCDKPARLSGPDTTVQCQASGIWSELQARCDIRCDPLDGSAIQNGALKTPGCSNGPQLVGQQCKIRCAEGYHVDGERSEKRVLRVLCDENGQWEGPDCVPNICPSLPVVYTGAYTCTDGLYSGSTCTMNCPDNLNSFRSVTCTDDGEWDSDFTMCPSDAPKTCDVIQDTDDVIFNCMDNNVGGKCSVKCAKRNQVTVYRRPHHDNDVMFDLDKLTCTVLQKWEPNPAYIVCEPECQMWELGDGFCDAINNRDICNWDDGDCCESTVLGGVVTPLPENCTSACKCRDPEASENQRRRRRQKLKNERSKYVDDNDDYDDLDL